MEKVFLALGHIQFEDYIQRQLEGKVKFEGNTVYKEGIVKGISQTVPDIAVIRETLTGNQNISEIIYEIRVEYPSVRIIFVAGKRDIGDALLSELVNLGIYDILTGEKTNANLIIDMILNPRTFKDVANLKIKTVINDKTNEKVFETPNQNVEEKIRTIYIDNTTPLSTVDKDIGITTEKNDKSLNINKEPEDTFNDIEIIVGQQQSIDSKVSVKSENPIITPVEPVINSQEIEERVKKLKETELKQKVKQEIRPIENIEKIVNQNIIDDVKFINEKNNPTTENKPKKTTGGLFGRKNNKDNNSARNVKQKLITFVGGSSGVGNTQIAFNTAIHLANEGYRTLYMDLNELGSSIDYLYQLGYFDVGIDKAINSLLSDDYVSVDKSIITMKRVLSNNNSEEHMIKNYKKFPKLLDFMFFSQEYCTRSERGCIEADGLKELCVYLLLQKEYDFIILDTKDDVYNKLTEIALNIATKVFITITQDVSVISLNIAKQGLMDKKRINYKDKFYYIVNKFENSDLSISNITEWIQKDIQVIVPNMNKEFINANYFGLPISLFIKNKEMIKAFSNIEKIIFS